MAHNRGWQMEPGDRVMVRGDLPEPEPTGKVLEVKGEWFLCERSSQLSWCHESSLICYIPKQTREPR